MGLNYNVWMPHLKFTLQTIAMTYAKPNDVSKRKYYDLIKTYHYFSMIHLEIIFRNFRQISSNAYLSSRMSFRNGFIYF